MGISLETPTQGGAIFGPVPICLGAALAGFYLKLDLLSELRKIDLKIQDKGTFIIDVQALGGRGYQGFCDNSTKALLLKSVKMGGRRRQKLSKRSHVWTTPKFTLKIHLSAT